VGVTVNLAPLYHKRVAIVVASLVSAAAVGFLGFILFQSMNADLNISLDGWYRQILDMLSIIMGAIFGAWMAYGNQRKRTHA
jgi:fructose-specific phosphotransferase system IIC component